LLTLLPVLYERRAQGQEVFPKEEVQK
jgi:hypothetical protein